MNHADCSTIGQAIQMSFFTRISPSFTLVAITVLAWIVIGVFTPWQSLANDTSAPVAITLVVWGWVLWLSVAISLLVPSPISATVVHTISPLAVVVAAWALDAPSLFASLVALIVLRSSIIMDYMVQGGAYGNEQRFALRTPVSFMAPAVLAWLVLTGTVLSSTLFLASKQWWFGAPLLVIGVVAVRIIPQRLHRLSRRWLVVVPSGIVIHDHLVLAETVMSLTNKIASIKVVDSTSDGADFTGGVIGPRLAVELRTPDKIVLSKITAKSLGTTEALHVQTYNVAPRRTQAAVSVLKR